jgi:hypothetical protein
MPRQPAKRLPHIILVLLTVTACSSTYTPPPPQLLSEITLAPGTQGALVLSASPTATPTNAPDTETPTPVPTPLDLSITDTPFPSLTPRPTRTATNTLTATLTPSDTYTPTRTPRILRTPTPTAPSATPTFMPCPDRWFFIPRPEYCPLGPYVIGPALIQQFEHGFMIWFGAQRTIFAAFQPPAKPRWQQFADKYADGIPESDPALVPPNGLIQPVRVLGFLWRSTPRLRQRLGWATSPEVAYQGVLQIDILGNRYIQGPNREVYQLSGDLTNWQIVSPKN